METNEKAPVTMNDINLRLNNINDLQKEAYYKTVLTKQVELMKKGDTTHKNVSAEERWAILDDLTSKTDEELQNMISELKEQNNKSSTEQFKKTESTGNEEYDKTAPWRWTDYDGD